MSIDLPLARPEIVVGNRFRDLTGQTFGRLLVVSIAGRDRQGRFIWRCTCKCGVKKDVPSRHIVQGNIVSCGCAGKETGRRNGKIGRDKISGEKSHLYKPALTEGDRLDRRNLVELRDWRSAVYARDNYTCDTCGEVGGRIEAHHLDCWSCYPSKRFDIDNGMTLCTKCHKAVHDGVGGNRKPCVAGDYFKFKAKWYIERELKKRGADA